MKTIKRNDIDFLKEKLTNEFLKERENWDSWNTENDISFIVVDNVFSVFYNDYGDWVCVDDYFIEE